MHSLIRTHILSRRVRGPSTSILNGLPMLLLLVSILPSLEMDAWHGSFPEKCCRFSTSPFQPFQPSVRYTHPPCFWRNDPNAGPTLDHDKWTSRTMLTRSVNCKPCTLCSIHSASKWTLLVRHHVTRRHALKHFQIDSRLALRFLSFFFFFYPSCHVDESTSGTVSCSQCARFLKL